MFCKGKNNWECYVELRPVNLTLRRHFGVLKGCFPTVAPNIKFVHFVK
jgi:hypothetical protein